MSSALIFGVGPGLGAALARRFARAHMPVGLVARNKDKLRDLLTELQAEGAPASRAWSCDVTHEEGVVNTFEYARQELGVPRLVVFNAGAFVHKGVLETRSEEFEQCWRIGCLGGFHVGRAAVGSMEGEPPEDGGALGTLIFTGATASLRGGARFHNLAVPKAGLRSLSQSMAREFGPAGVHVAHVIIDGQIRNEARGLEYSEAERGEDALLHPDAIAEQYWQLHCQPRNAWTQELDLRPWVERF